MKKFTENAQDYFDRHPSSDECHITSDGRVFHNKGGALGFAGTLDNQEIESYSRKVLEKEKSLQSDIENTGESDISHEAKLKELETLELTTANYNEMKILVKFFDVKVDNQKAETLITALTEYKKTINQQ